MPWITPRSRSVLPFCIVAISLVVMLQSGSSAWAGALSLPPVADTSLRNGLSANTSFGAATALPVGVSTPGNTINHVLLKFPIESIPSNATVTQVTVQVTSINGNQSVVNYQLFRVLKTWNETDSTWNTRLAPAISWGGPGGQSGIDYLDASSAIAPLAPAPGVNRFSSAGLLGDVQLWQANPTTNFGWILIAENEQPGSGKQIGSREDTLNAPVLTINYSLPAPPVLLDPVAVNTNFFFSFNAVSNHAHTVEFNNALSTTNWVTLTNIPPLPADAIIHITNSGGGVERYFRVGVQ